MKRTIKFAAALAALLAASTMFSSCTLFQMAYDLGTGSFKYESNGQTAAPSTTSIMLEGIISAVQKSEPSFETAAKKEICLTDTEIIDHGRYTGNQGDSTIFNLDGKGLTMYDNGTQGSGNGNIGVDDEIYNNGFEAWIARWNYSSEISWAYATFKLDSKYTRLTGNTSLIKSYNTSNFNTTIYFYNGDNLIASYTLTPDNYKQKIDINVTNVDALKLLVKDNIAVAGGTSFALYDMYLK